MSRIVFINPVADFSSNPISAGSWNSYLAPELLKDFFEKKGVESEFLNLNEMFLRKFFSEPFSSEFLILSKKYLSNLEKNEHINVFDTVDYFSLKFLMALTDQNKLKYVPWSPKPSTNLLMKDVDIVQAGTIKIDREGDEFNRRVHNFNKVMESVLRDYDFNNKLLVFSIPSKIQMCSIIQTGKLVKKLFPTCKVLIGGSYIKFTSFRILDELVNSGIIDMYIKDADEGKLLCLAKDFLEGTLGDFKGSYMKSVPVSINDLVRTHVKDTSRRVELLLTNGCYWGRCRYCEFPVVRKGFAIKNTDVIVNEIEHFYKQGARTFRLLTDCLIPAVGVKIAKALIERDIKINWDSGFIRIDLGFTKEVILLLKESGFRFDHTVVGMESCVDASLKSVDKGYDRKIIETFFNNFRELDTKFNRVNIIFDLPGTTVDDLSDMKKFVLSLYDVSTGFLASSLFLSDQVEYGIHPEKYGITILGVDEESMSGDALLFTVENGISLDDKETMKRFFRFIGLLYTATRFYPRLDFSILGHTKIYSEKDFRLMVKTADSFISFDSGFDENGTRASAKFTMPESLKEFASESFFLFRLFGDKLEKDRWYSVGDMADIIGCSSQIEKMKLMQKVFHGVIALLACGGFADAKVENIAEKHIAEK